MSDPLALFDVHIGNAPDLSELQALEERGLVRVVSGDVYDSLMAHCRLRGSIDALEAERASLRRPAFFPSARRRRREAVQTVTVRISELYSEASELRRLLSSAGVTGDAPSDYARLEDGSAAALTRQGQHELFDYLYSERSDEVVDAAALDRAAELWTLTHSRLLDELGRAAPPPVMATTAAILCYVPTDRHDQGIEACLETFSHWRRTIRDCSADRLALAALLAAASRAEETAEQTLARASDYLDKLVSEGFQRGRESWWAAGLLLLRHADNEDLRRVVRTWHGMITAGWSMSPATYPYAARLGLLNESAVKIASRVEDIYEEAYGRMAAEGRVRTVAASVLAQHALYPQPRQDRAELGVQESPYARMIHRAEVICRELERDLAGMMPREDLPVVAAILARLPGGVHKVVSLLTYLTEKMRAAEIGKDPAPATSEANPVTAAALLLTDSAYAGRISNLEFALEACAVGSPETYDPYTMFRLSSAGWYGIG